MSKSKITITLDAILVEELNRLSEKLKEPRSQIVEKAIRFWQRKVDPVVKTKNRGF